MSNASLDLDHPVYDPADPGFAARSSEAYRIMRDDLPLYRDPDGAFYALSRFEDVRAATLDPVRYSSVSIESAFAKPSLNFIDPPRHGELRGLVSRAFTNRRVTALEDGIRDIAGSLLDEADLDHFDVATDYAGLIPSRVIGRMLGLPDELVPVCKELTDLNKRRTGPEGRAIPANRSYEIFTDLYEQRRTVPGDDLLTALVGAEVDGQRLTQDELLAFAWLLLVGGNDTTAGMIANGIDLLARHPDARRELAADRSLLPSAVEEVLRIASPNHALPRTATCDVETPYGTIPEGERVLMLWAAANLDDREFVDPERFDIHRESTRHLAFGHGIHFCIGAALARLEGRVAFEELLRRMPEFAIAEEPERVVSAFLATFEHLVIAPA